MIENIKRIAISGDWHGDMKFSKKAVHFAKRHGADALLHVGDFGFWGLDDSFLKVLSEEVVSLDLPIFFIDGNHEDHQALNLIPLNDDKTRTVAENIFHLPRGFRWEWDGVSFLALGGAPSFDRGNRTEGFDWFPEETISTGDSYRAVADGHADIMLTHDAPSSVIVPDLPLREVTQIEKDCAQHRRLLDSIVEQVTPNYLFHGHYHKFYNDLVEYDSHKTLVVGLDMNRAPSLEWNTQILNVSALKSDDWTPVRWINHNDRKF